MNIATKRTGIAFAALAALAPSFASANDIYVSCNQYSGKCEIIECKDVPTEPSGLPGYENPFPSTSEVCSSIGTFGA